MNKNEFICNLKAEINNGEALLDRFERFQEYHDDLGDGMAHFGTGYRHKYNPVEKKNLANDFTLWERRVLEILKCYLGENSSVVEEEFTTSEPRYWMNFKRIQDMILQHC